MLETHVGTGVLIRVCAWCLNSSSADVTAANDCAVSHVICRRHFRRMKWELRGKKPLVHHKVLPVQRLGVFGRFNESKQGFGWRSAELIFMLRDVAALCVSGRSYYKYVSGVHAFDRARDARTFRGGIPVVAHPPCRLWSEYLRGHARCEDVPGEMALGLWCVEQVKKNGGVLEQPARSRLWSAAGLPLPGDLADPFLYSVYVEQRWFGYGGRRFSRASISALNRNSVGLIDGPARPCNFFRVKPIVRASQLMSSAWRQAPSDCAAPVCHSSS
jgi:hypothetical protein